MRSGKPPGPNREGEPRGERSIYLYDQFHDSIIGSPKSSQNFAQAKYRKRYSPHSDSRLAGTRDSYWELAVFGFRKVCLLNFCGAARRRVHHNKFVARRGGVGLYGIFLKDL